MRLFLTGGNGAIGSAIKEKFISEGYEVIAPSSSELDLSEAKNIDKFFEKISPEFDVLIHCAGYNNPKSINEIANDEFLKTQQINLFSWMKICQICVPYMKQKNQGHILGIASLYATISKEGRTSYSVSKHGMLGLMRTMALEFGANNILCNTLSPGFVETKMTQKNNTKEQLEKLEEKIPLGKMAQPADIADVAYFMCSSANKYISGQNIIVDGGFMAGGFQK